jgi:hypothetical protein
MRGRRAQWLFAAEARRSPPDVEQQAQIHVAEFPLTPNPSPALGRGEPTCSLGSGFFPVSRIRRGQTWLEQAGTHSHSTHRSRPSETRYATTSSSSALEKASR